MPQPSIDQALATAVEHHSAGRLAEAESIYRQVLQQQPDNPNALHLLGLIALDTGQPDAAIALIRRAVAVRPQTAALHMSLGRACEAAGKSTDAIAAYEDAARLDAQNPQPWLALGNVLFAVGQMTRAEVVYRTAAALAPQDGTIRNNLAAVLIQLDREDEAATVCEAALSEPG